MSLYRFVYYSAVVGGWAAFLAWIVAETCVLHAPWVAGLAGWFTSALSTARDGAAAAGTLRTALVGGLVGATIGAGLDLLGGLAAGQWKIQRNRLLLSVVCGLAGGMIGGGIGDLLYNAVGLPRAFGWMIMGLAIGGTEGGFEKSSRRLRNGFIGGGLGGLLGGVFFVLLADASGMGARATAFVVLGISIATLVGLANVVLKDAWVTVLDGFRPGSELILTKPVTLLGRGDHLPLPLLGVASREVEGEHARIIRTPEGHYIIEDNRSRIGTVLNSRQIRGPVVLADGDLIKLGGNILRFHARCHQETRPAAVPGPSPVADGTRSVPATAARGPGPPPLPVGRSSPPPGFRGTPQIPAAPPPPGLAYPPMTPMPVSPAPMPQTPYPSAPPPPGPYPPTPYPAAPYPPAPYPPAGIPAPPSPGYFPQ
jgi:hypothetical protein